MPAFNGGADIEVGVSVGTPVDVGTTTLVGPVRLGREMGVFVMPAIVVGKPVGNIRVRVGELKLGKLSRVV